ncbi:MAG: hypothetical protein O8C64_04905 [Candidatus Methanoperedens sp.]|nr:hypothetical protein [Candidatus Methanoperedens sp.]
MAETDFYIPPQDESKLEFAIHNLWIPEWHLAKINIYIYHLEHFDIFSKDILKLELSNEVDKDSMKDFLIVEVILSTMFLIESFAAVAQACSTSPKNIQKYLKEFDATGFYSKISSKDNVYYAQILSVPQIDFISGEKEILFEGIKDFKGFLNEVKEYYFSNLDLFNSYKHSFRLFPFSTIGKNEEPVSAIMYFSQRHKQDEVVITTLDKNPQKHEKLARDLIYFIRVILNNPKNKLKNPENWEATIPMRNKGDLETKTAPSHENSPH